jgi:hypothetical protein
MPSILDAEKLKALVEFVKTPEHIDAVIAKFDPSSKDTPLFLQELEIAGKGKLIEEYVASFAPTED